MGGRGSSSASGRTSELQGVQIPVGWQTALAQGRTMGFHFMAAAQAQYAEVLDAVER